MSNLECQFVRATSFTCSYCRALVPQLVVIGPAFDAVERALPSGSRTLASLELKHFVGCSDGEAQAWVDHLLSCAYAWPTADSDALVIQCIDQAFVGIDKPEHFMDYTHCPECAEHDATLRAKTRETLKRQDLGDAGWDPILFCSEDGIAYSFPALARVALLPAVWRDNSWYGSQLLSHLSIEGAANRFLAWCSPTQRSAVYALLQHMMTTRLEAISEYGDHDALLDALSAWNPAAGPLRRRNRQ